MNSWGMNSWFQGSAGQQGGLQRDSSSSSFDCAIPSDTESNPRAQALPASTGRTRSPAALSLRTCRAAPRNWADMEDHSSDGEDPHWGSSSDASFRVLPNESLSEADSSNMSGDGRSLSSDGHSSGGMAQLRKPRKLQNAKLYPLRNYSGSTTPTDASRSITDEISGSADSGTEDSSSQMGGQQQVPPDVSQLSMEQLEALKTSVPLDEDGQMTSVGSATHDLGTCKPCLFNTSKNGCTNGVLCGFCHFQHKRKNKPRPCKGKRDRYRRLVSRMEDMIHDNPDLIEEADLIQFPPSIEQNPKLKSKLVSKMEIYAEEIRIRDGGCEDRQQGRDSNTASI
eukprot:gnl/TRDRNA2_/TRDRNA2_153405_c0_seq3.p1 gnl/TRDRNA2_/TRDRNA2_153405_c0~~gnl/TRDRNA2_/TRDRNA2_153405_c0_seq3.p1  ORF type:complete len:339 (+),score=57.43 gnl/TRDRNA2_/TRDRNA2_153405_c0_seq3:93-1109(+)